MQTNKAQHRACCETQHKDQVMKNSMVNTFFAALQNNPSLAAGSCTFAVAFALVAGNAFYAQSGNHPDPIWATRDATVTRSVSPEVRSVKVSAVAPKSIPIPQKSGNVASAAPAKSELVADIQAALMKIGGWCRWRRNPKNLLPTTPSLVFTSTTLRL